MDRKQLKAAAKGQIKGKIGMLFLISLIIALVSGVASLILGLIPIVGSLLGTIIVTPAFALSTVRVYLNVVRGGSVEASQAFSGFDDFWSAFKVQFLVGLFTFLWSLLFVIPGIIKGYSYSMSMYVLAENKGKPALQCIDESKKMMNGHKMELFVLELSFIGWMLLGVVTLGIAMIWVVPYMSATETNFYNAIKPQPVFEAEAAPAEEPAAE